jgi:hypothetical protein
MEEIIFGVGRFLGRFLLEIPIMWTGEKLLYLFSFGKRKPRWDLYADESGSKFVIFSDISLWIGLVFWLGMVVLIIKSIN